MQSMESVGSGTTVGSAILVVDDSHHNLFMLERRLLSYHYQVTTASSGQSALDAAFEQTPDLILLDVGMDEMDGFAVKEALNQNDATMNVPVIFISDRNEIEYKMQAFGLGAEDFLTKPLHQEELMARIDIALRRQMRERQLADELTRLEQHMQTGGVELADEEEATDQLEQCIHMANSRKEPLSALHVKVTGLADMNNPPAVRVVLMEVGDILKNMINPSTDQITAYQEEGEYLLFSIGMSIERATILAEGLKSQVLVRAFSDDSAQEHLKLSIGIAGHEPGGEVEPAAILAGAREAVDQAVEAGSDRVVVKRVSE